MDTIFQQLLESFCLPYGSNRIPENRDPVRAYGRCAFGQGFKLALRIAACALSPEAPNG